MPRRSPRGIRIRQRIERRADDLAGELRGALIACWTVLAELVGEEEVVRRIRIGLPAFTDAEIERALALVRLRIRNGVERAGDTFTRRPV